MLVQLQNFFAHVPRGTYLSTLDIQLRNIEMLARIYRNNNGFPANENINFARYNRNADRITQVYIWANFYTLFVIALNILALGQGLGVHHFGELRQLQQVLE